MDYKVDDKNLDVSMFILLSIKYGKAIMTWNRQGKHYLKH